MKQLKNLIKQLWGGGRGGGLSQLNHYVALTKDNNLVHLKPLPNILVISNNNTGTTIYKRTDNQDGKEKITLENGKNKLTDWNYGFYFSIGMKQNQIISFDFFKYKTNYITSMTQMFYGCSGLTSLDLSSFDTSNVTNMSGMFYDCRSLTSLDLSNFDTSNVTNMLSMFASCRSLTSLDLSNFDTSNVTIMQSMFYGCNGLTSLDLSNFDTSKVTTMYYMFNGCSKLSKIKCKQAFKDWCINHQDEIELPETMVNGTVGAVGSGSNWEIVDYQA